MNISWLPRSLALLTVLAGASFANTTNGADPAVVKLKVYEFRVSRNADCSNSIHVDTPPTPTYQDMTHNPTLGGGRIDDGTYNCVMMRMSDLIRYTPANALPGWTGACAVGTEYVTGVAHDETAIDPDGTVHTIGPDDGTESIVWLYIRTGAPTAGNTHAFVPTGGIPLTSPLVVNGDTAHTMVFDFTGRIDEGPQYSGGPAVCGCGAPTLAFR